MKFALSAWTLMLGMNASTVGRAQTNESPGSPRAPRNALELSASTGYAQGFGTLHGGVGMPSVAAGGFGIEFGIGYRIEPRWAVLWSGQYQELDATRGDSVRGFTSSLAGQYHFNPVERIDPWLEVGAGSRTLWESPSIGPTMMTFG